MRQANPVLVQALQEDSPARRSIGPLVVLSFVCLAYCAWILSLPLFPTQDGPVHLYFAHVLQALILHTDPGIYPRFYVVKHVLSPYALYYYLLLALGNSVSLVTADKLIVCLYVVLFLFGFRYLARSVGPAGDTVALLATPLVLNWPLAMGFVNFDLATAVSLYSLGLWIRVAVSPDGARDRFRWFGFFALCTVMMLTHPVPLLFVLGFTAVDLTMRFTQTDYRGSRRLAHAAVSWLVAASTLFYVHVFAGGNVLRQTAANRDPYLITIIHNAPAMLLLNTLTVFAGRGALDVFYRGSIIFMLILALVLGRRELYRSQRAGHWTVANTWFVLGVLLALALPFVPPDLNGSHFFAARLVLYVWLALLAGASGSFPQTGGMAATRLTTRLWFRAAAVVFAVVVTVIILVLGQQRIRPMAIRIAEIESASLPFTRRVALMLNDETYTSPNTVNFDPYRWSGIRILRRTDSVLYNTPWLDLAIIPLGLQANMPTGRIAPLSLEYVPYLRRDLVTSAAVRDLVFPAIDLAVINHGGVAFGATPDPILASDPVAGRYWTCVTESMYSLCSAVK